MVLGFEQSRPIHEMIFRSHWIIGILEIQDYSGSRITLQRIQLRLRRFADPDQKPTQCHLEASGVRRGFWGSDEDAPAQAIPGSTCRSGFGSGAGGHGQSTKSNNAVADGQSAYASDSFPRGASHRVAHAQPRPNANTRFGARQRRAKSAKTKRKPPLFS